MSESDDDLFAHAEVECEPTFPLFQLWGGLDVNQIVNQTAQAMPLSAEFIATIKTWATQVYTLWRRRARLRARSRISSDCRCPTAA